MKDDSITFVEEALMAHAGAVSMNFEVEAPSVCAGISSMTFAMDASRAHGWAVPMALDVEALMALAAAASRKRFKWILRRLVQRQ